jgi:hypothetical protein
MLPSSTLFTVDSPPMVCKVLFGDLLGTVYNYIAHYESLMVYLRYCENCAKLVVFLQQNIFLPFSKTSELNAAFAIV